VSTLTGRASTMDELMAKAKILNYCADAYLASTCESADSSGSYEVKQRAIETINTT